MSEHDQEIEELDPEADDQPEDVDHPDELDDHEAEQGQAEWQAVDDLDDNSGGSSQ